MLKWKIAPPDLHDAVYRKDSNFDISDSSDIDSVSDREDDNYDFKFIDNPALGDFINNISDNDDENNQTIVQPAKKG